MSESMRDRIRDELAGWVIGSGYYATAVSVEDARDMADAVLAVLADHDAKVRAEALLARIREFVTERTDGYPDDPYDFVREFALGVLAILDGDNDD